MGVATKSLGEILYRPAEVIRYELKRGVNTSLLRRQYGVTAHSSGRNGFDVTRLVATEHSGNIDSILESFPLSSVTLLI